MDNGYSIIGAYEVKCSNYNGSLTLTFPVDTKYNGRDFVVAHRTSTGKIFTYSGIVKEGKIVIAVTELSPFMIAIKGLSETPDTDSNSDSNVDSWDNPFVDVNENDWFYNSIEQAYKCGIMQGTSVSAFEPQAFATRAMFVTLVYNMAGNPDIIADDTSWYAKGRAWAMEKGISDGTNMQNTITREQLITMLWRYAGEPDVVDYEGLTGFNDADQIAGYARQAFAWAYKEGIIAGKGNGILDPNGYATRAETAKIIINYLKTTEK